MGRVYKRWAVGVLAGSLSLLAMVALVNVWIDPTWLFTHEHTFNDRQAPYDERLMKTNRAAFQPFSYDALVIGSSRTALIDTRDFAPHDAFNYAVSNMSLQEYQPLIQFAKKRRGAEIGTIFIGLDFFAVNQHQEIGDIEEDINQVGTFAYRIKQLVSKDILIESFRSARVSYRDDDQAFPRTYNRQGVLTARRYSESLKERNVQGDLKRYREKYEQFTYNSDARNLLLEVKNNNPHTKFIVFTTPASKALFDLMIEKKRWPDYERWIREAVDVFGEIYHFDYPNTVTVNLDNYYDANHYYPSVGRLIAHRLVGTNDGQIPSDFGMRITSENVDGQLAVLRNQFGALRR